MKAPKKLDLVFSEFEDLSLAVDSHYPESTGHLSASDRDSLDDAESRFFGYAENRKVRNLKKLVFLFLFLVTVGVCLTMFFLTQREYLEELELE